MVRWANEGGLGTRGSIEARFCQRERAAGLVCSGRQDGQGRLGKKNSDGF